MNIVVAYRKSHLSSRLLEKTIEQSQALGGKVHLITSLPGGPTQSARGVKESRSTLDEALRLLEKEAIPCESHLLLGGQSSGEDIIAFAQKYKADMIIIGVEKKSKVGKFIMGSTAQHVITHADCPVYTVK